MKKPREMSDYWIELYTAHWRDDNQWSPMRDRERAAEFVYQLALKGRYAELQEFAKAAFAHYAFSRLGMDDLANQAARGDWPPRPTLDGTHVASLD